MSISKKIKVYETSQINETDIIKQRYGVTYQVIDSNTKKPRLVPVTPASSVVKPQSSDSKNSILTSKETTKIQEENSFQGKSEIFTINPSKNEFKTSEELNNFINSINSTIKTVHDCEIKVPFTNKEESTSKNFGNTYKADYQLDYNFLIENYETAISDTLIRESCLPNLYMFMYSAQEKELGSQYNTFTNFITLQNLIPNSFVANKNKLKKESSDEKGEYFDKFAFYLPDAALQRTTTTLADQATNIIFPHEELSNILDFNKYKELFPMYCDFILSMDKFSQFSETLRESNLTLSLIYYLISNTLTTNSFILTEDNFINNEYDQNVNQTLTSQQEVQLLDVSSWWESLTATTISKPANSVVMGIDNNSTLSPLDRKNEFYKNLSFLIFQGKLRKLIDQHLKLYTEILRGEKCYTETVIYNIVKYEGNSVTPLQSFWIPNDPKIDLFNFVDTQLIYGKNYKYEIYAYNLIIGSTYSLNVLNTSETLSNYEIQIQANIEPSVQLAKVKIFEKSKPMVDDLPIAPEVVFYPFRSVNNKIKIFLNNAVGMENKKPISILDTDDIYFNNIFLKHDLEPDSQILFESEDNAKEFQIFKTTTKPTSYKDLSTSFYRTIINEFGSGTAFTDSISPNKKYYYVFRTVDYHDNISNPSPLYEVEIIDDDGAIYPIIKVVDFAPQSLVSTTKPMKKLIQLKPSQMQLMINETKSKFLEKNSVNDFMKDSLFIGMEKESAWNKTYKLRLTSKKTGKKIDINFTLSTDLVKDS
jgi:hypothetical protein